LVVRQDFVVEQRQMEKEAKERKRETEYSGRKNLKINKSVLYTRGIPPEDVSAEPRHFRSSPIQYLDEFERGKRTPALFRRRILCGLGKPYPHHRYRARAAIAVSTYPSLAIPPANKVGRSNRTRARRNAHIRNKEPH